MFAYPLPRDETDDLAAGAGQLDSLLTPIRARLPRLLTRERSMGELAVLPHCRPSTIAHHCDRLAAAGPLERHREGTSVHVVRTSRAELILDFYGG